MVDNFFIWILCVLADAYLVRILLFDGTKGPFARPTKFIVDDGTHEGAVDLFDYVRRLFGAYRVEDAGEGAMFWRTTVRMDVWRCPRCLSFWVSFLVSVPFTLYLGEQNVLLFPVLHLAFTFVTQLLVFVQLKIEN